VYGSNDKCNDNFYSEQCGFCARKGENVGKLEIKNYREFFCKRDLKCRSNIVRNACFVCENSSDLMVENQVLVHTCNTDGSDVGEGDGYASNVFLCNCETAMLNDFFKPLLCL
jgi:hypothetical protein